jgi:hypothetical protein
MIIDMNVTSVLVDGSHHYEDAINDLHLAMRLINFKPGCIIIDDADIPDVAKAQAEFLEIYNANIGGTLDIYPELPGHILAYRINQYE